jgi:translation initiation factor IF-2
VAARRRAGGACRARPRWAWLASRSARSARSATARWASGAVVSGPHPRGGRHRGGGRRRQAEEGGGRRRQAAARPEAPRRHLAGGTGGPARAIHDPHDPDAVPRWAGPARHGAGRQHRGNHRHVAGGQPPPRRLPGLRAAAGQPVQPRLAGVDRRPHPLETPAPAGRAAPTPPAAGAACARGGARHPSPARPPQRGTRWGPSSRRLPAPPCHGRGRGGGVAGAWRGRGGGAAGAWRGRGTRGETPSRRQSASPRGPATGWPTAPADPPRPLQPPPRPPSGPGPSSARPRAGGPLPRLHRFQWELCLTAHSLAPVSSLHHHLI